MLRFLGNPCTIYIEHNHNHALESLDAISFKDVPKDVEVRVVALYEEGLNRTEAYHEFTRQLRASSKSDLEYSVKKAD